MKQLIFAAASMLACAFLTPAFAQTCCPAGCVQNAPNQCVTTGPVQNSCGNTFTCPPGPGGSSGGASGSGTIGVIFPRPFVPQCGAMSPSQAAVNAATDQCVRNLTGSAIFVRCFFEDDAGRAEDERTGLTCAARQAALASQCRSRCAVFAFASNRPWCFDDPNRLWHDSFGDISGDVVGSARIEGCGPPLRDGFFRRAGRSRPQRLHP